MSPRDESAAAGARSSRQNEQSPGEAGAKQAASSARRAAAHSHRRDRRAGPGRPSQHVGSWRAGLTRGAAARPHRGANLPGRGPRTPPPRRGGREKPSTPQRPARPSDARLGRLGPRKAGGRKGSERNGGESFIFRLEKWREPRPFFKLSPGKGGGCATYAARTRPSPAPRAPSRTRSSPLAPEGASRPL